MSQRSSLLSNRILSLLTSGLLTLTACGDSVGPGGAGPVEPGSGGAGGGNSTQAGGGGISGGTPSTAPSTAGGAPSTGGAAPSPKGGAPSTGGALGGTGGAMGGAIGTAGGAPGTGGTAGGAPGAGGGNALPGGAGAGSGGAATGPAEVEGAGIFPPAGALNVNPDTYLRITFDGKPSVNTGVIEIHDASNDQLVDSINVEQDTTKAGPRIRRDGADLTTFLVDVVDKTIIINPHSEKLSYGKTYNVVIGGAVFGGKLGGQDYAGTSGAQWQFTTKASGPTGATVSVDDNGPADFGSVQGALNYIMESHGGTTEARLNVQDGIYLGVLGLSDKSNIRVVGQSREKTIVRARNGNKFNPGDNTRALLTVSGGDLVSFENISIHNTATRGGGDGQAEALYYAGSGRFVAKNAAFYSEQDTILVKGEGHAWFYQSLISGNVDFIWGSPVVALFENSEIRTVGDSGKSGSTGGYVLQARVKKAAQPGFVFLNSMFTRGKGPAGNSPADGATYLGRDGGSHDSIAFINCKMDQHISSDGFRGSPSSGSVKSGFREFGTTTLAGGTVSLDSRKGVYKLTSAEVDQYYANRTKIFSAGGIDWTPTP